MKHKILSKTCRFCGKEFKSMYPKQLKYNTSAHELSCKQRIIKEEYNKLNKEETK